MLRARLRAIYAAEIGLREATGHNDGPRVEEYLRYTGLKTGNPWCAAFVCWALGKARIDNPRSAWSPDLFPQSKIVWVRCRSAKGSKSADSFLPGNVFGIWLPEKNRIAHCGFIDGRLGSWVLTVEGNTNMNGSRDGDGVYRKRRLIQALYQVADFVTH